MNNATVNMVGVYIFLVSVFIFSSGKYQGVKLNNHMAVLSKGFEGSPYALL